MNEHLQERFGRSTRGRQATGVAEVWLLPQKLNTRIREYYEAPPASGGSWLARPELPTAAEVLDTDLSGTDSDTANVVTLAPNKKTGAWDSNEEYLSTQYELLREDSLRPLREAVSRLKVTPTAAEDAFNGQVGIYEKVHICAVTPSTKGVAVRVTFSTIRAGKQILWEQSKRLISGGLVVLTPASDMYQSTAIVATVAARPLAGVTQNPPELDLFFARSDELEVDPSIEYVMVEDRSSFFGAQRHILLALQRLMKEPFPFAEHIVRAEAAVPAPQYVQDHSIVDLTPILTNNKHETYENVDVLRQWPAQPQSDLDASQLAAVRRIMTKQLAIVQGPPGTGKTFVSVQAIKVMLANRKHDDPPIIIACQTNHAVDQILRHIAQFEPDFIRLGGQSKDKDVIKKRSLFEVRNQTSENPPSASYFGSAKKKMVEMTKEIGVVLGHLAPRGQLLDHRFLVERKIMTKTQADSLDRGASKWVQHNKSGVKDSPFKIWLGDRLVPVPHKQPGEDTGFDYEEVDLEFEQLKEFEAENVTRDDDELDTLRGGTMPIADNFTCRKVAGMSVNVKDLLRTQDLWSVPDAYRGAVYRYLQQEMKKDIRTEFREKAQKFDDLAFKRRIGRAEFDEPTLKRQKIIGMTTTGLSMHRGILSALQPNICLIEEAGETLESYVTAACFPSLQQLILVGDHKQLRPHTQVKAHEDDPYNLNLSLFERLIGNKIEYDTLTKQRRMIPEIRRVLYPIYKNIIEDHPSVLDPEKRPNVPGMGGVNSWFLTHQWPEQRDEHMSCINIQEANMIVGFVEHLVYNGMLTEDITVLTFYNGQRKRLLSMLRQRPILTGRKFNVVTVDSYQGEENKVVLLSLVRSNEHNAIGFLSVDNRVCVALSRAQCGFYIFGNGEVLYNSSSTWATVLCIMRGKHSKKDLKKNPNMQKEIPAHHPSRLDGMMITTCKNHGTETHIQEPDDWDSLVGGCKKPCGGQLPCGHTCELLCHPFSHEEVVCKQCLERCERELTAAVPAKSRSTSNRASSARGSPNHSGASAAGGHHPGTSDSDSWQEFATTEPGRYRQRTDAAFNSRSQSERSGSSPEKPGAKAEGKQPLRGIPEKSGAKAEGKQPLQGSPEKKTVPQAEKLLELDEDEGDVDATVVGGMGELVLGDGAGGGGGNGGEAFGEGVVQPRDWSREASLLDD